MITQLKTLPALFLLTLPLLTACGQRVDDADDVSSPLDISVSNKRPVDVNSFLGAGQYAAKNQYYSYSGINLEEGMDVMFSASYGSGGGEAGQARGILVKGDNGDLYYQQKNNTTMQLLLPPGLIHNRGSLSRWNVTRYMDYVNRVAFAESAARGSYGAGTEIYEAVSAQLVDFSGGTASRSTSYKDAMELRIQKNNADRSLANVSIYFAKGVGAVALEFRETGSVGGTFKIYIGNKRE